MSMFSRLAIVGVGLIGGSIGRAARERGVAGQVVGFVRSQGSADRAQAAGVVDQVTLDPASACQDADLVIFCTPVGSIVASLENFLPHLSASALLTDAGSTKTSIVAQADALLAAQPTGPRFVGSHPLAGDHRTGPEAARADLLVNRTVVVTPVEATDHDAQQRVSQFWTALGANVLEMTPAKHDAALAKASHLPHVVASVLAAATPDAALPLAASGWSDTTRIAAGDPTMWLDIVRDNRAEVLTAARGFSDHLHDFITALDQCDWQAVRQHFEQAKQRREAADPSVRE